MLYYEVYEQLPPKAIPGTLRRVRLESGKCVDVPDFAPNLKLVAEGEAQTAEEAWKTAKEVFKHPVLKFPGVQYRQLQEG